MIWFEITNQSNWCACQKMKSPHVKKLKFVYNFFDFCTTAENSITTLTQYHTLHQRYVVWITEREKGENSWWCWALEKPRHIFLLCLILHRRKTSCVCQFCIMFFIDIMKEWDFLLNCYFEVFFLLLNNQLFKKCMN